MAQCETSCSCFAQICGCCYGNRTCVSVCLICLCRLKKALSPEAAAMLQRLRLKQQVSGLDSEGKRQITEHLVVIHCSLQMPPPPLTHTLTHTQNIYKYQMRSRLMKVCMQRWGITFAFTRLKWRPGSIEIGRSAEITVEIKECGGLCIFLCEL